MKLLAVGDSFTYGDELQDQSNAWPFLLGKHISYDVKNLALPAKSNDYIVRTVVENADEYDLVIIAWSHYARMEFSDDLGTYDIWPGNAGKLFPDKMSYRKELIEYMNRHYDDVHSYTKYLLNIILLQGYLEQNNKRYVMLDAFGNTQARDLNTILVKKINSANYLGWPNESMMEWTYGCIKGSNGHFLEDGHKLVADKIYEHIRHLSWIS
jgi:lysophospholipase L1-like esterase